MIQFSGALQSKGLPTWIKSAQDVDILMKEFEDVVRNLNFWQYYVLDPKRERDSVKSAFDSQKIIAWSGADVEGKSVVTLAEILRSENKIVGLGKLTSRFGVHVEPVVAAGFVKAAFRDVHDIDALADAWVRIVDVINVPLYEEWEEDTRVAVSSVKNRLTYTRLDEHGPRLGEISKT